MNGLLLHKCCIPLLAGCLCIGMASPCHASIWGGDGHDGQLGDQAYAVGDYAMSVKFYQRWLDGAEDQQTKREASIRLVGACLRVGSKDRAVKYLNALRQQYPNPNDPELTLLDAEIKLTESNATEVRRSIEKFLQRNDLNDNLRWQGMELLGRALMTLKEWDEAGKVFAMLERSGPGTKWEYIGFCKRVYALIMDGQAQEASKLLTANLKHSEIDGRFEVKVLNLLLQVKEKHMTEFKDSYSRLRQTMPGRPDPLMYQVLIDAADNYLALKEYEPGLNYLSEAVAFAPDTTSRNRAFRLTINSALNAGKVDQALSTGEEYLNFNRGGGDENAIVMEVAGLYASRKKIDSAVKLYFSLMDDHTRSMPVRIEAARAAGNLLAAEHLFPDSEKAFDFICRNGSDSMQQAEGFMLLGKLYFNQEFYLRAAELFIRAGDMNRSYRADSLYWAMRAYIELKEYGQALEIVEKIKRLDAKPEWVRQELIYYSGIIAQRTGRNEAACDMLVNYAKLYPDAEHAPEGLFRAGEIAVGDRKYVLAATIFQSFAVRYPRHESAPAAIYRRLQALFLSGKSAQAVSAAAQLQKDYPDSRYTPAALFWLVDYYRDAGELKKALDILNQLTFKYSADKEVLAEALRDTAVVSRRAGDDEQAKTALTRLIKDLPKSKFVAEARYLLGDISSDSGDYETAIADYTQCQNLSPNQEMAWAVAGRLADCQYSQFARTGEDKNITQAIAEYIKLLKQKNLPAPIREQTLFKLGKCYETRKDIKSALELYMEVLYSYGREIADPEKQRRNPLWVVNSAQAAIDIYLAMNNAGAAQAAINVYRIMEKMQVNTGENFKARIESIRRRYNMK